MPKMAVIKCHTITELATFEDYNFAIICWCRHNLVKAITLACSNCIANLVHVTPDKAKKWQNSDETVLPISMMSAKKIGIQHALVPSLARNRDNSTGSVTMDWLKV